jgi:hypothetical protein
MAEISDELIYEVVKQVQDRLVLLERKADGIKGEVIVIRLHSLAIQQYVGNIYTTLRRHDERLDRIERRLEIAGTV